MDIHEIVDRLIQGIDCGTEHAAELTGLRRAMSRVASRYIEAALRDTRAALWEDPNVYGNLMAYVEGVKQYLIKVCPHYPVDVCRVALNTHIRPRLWLSSDINKVDAHHDCETVDSVLVDVDGRYYADPLSVVARAALPYTIDRVLFADGDIRSFTESVKALGQGAPDTRFIWDTATFPIAGAFLENGGLLIRGPNGSARRPTWTHIHSGTPELGELITGPPPGVSLPVPPRDIVRAPPKSAIREKRREQTSALKGARGEAIVYQILSQGGYTVRDVSHRARSADMVVTSQAGEVYVDSKSYTTAVPSKETQKFRRDLGARGAAAGVLVSLTSGIVGVRGVLTARLVALPEKGRMVPLVYVTSSHPEVITAAVSLAVHLARLRPETSDARTLHGQDALESYTVGLEHLADAYEDARADLARFALESMEKCAGVVSKIAGALRDHRRLAKVQRAAIDPPADRTLDDTPALWSEISTRYPIVPGAETALANIIGRLAESALGDIKPANRWRFQKTKATHISSGVVLVFLKKRTDICIPVAQMDGGRVGDLLARHIKKIRISDGTLSLELGGDTEADAMTLW